MTSVEMCGVGLRVAESGSRIAFRRRTRERLFSALAGVFLLVGAPLQYGQGAMVAVHRHQPVPVWADVALVIGVVIGGGFGRLFFYMAGPRDLHLDLDRRTYRFISWWPRTRRVQEGSWQDMAGVYVRPRVVRGSARYMVAIAWRQERRQFPKLGSFTREAEAVAMAEDVSALLGLPRVAPPPTGRTSVDPAEALLRQESPKPPFRPFRPSPLPPPAVTELTADTRQPPA